MKRITAINKVRGAIIDLTVGVACLAGLKREDVVGVLPDLIGEMSDREIAQAFGVRRQSASECLQRSFRALREQFQLLYGNPFTEADEVEG